MKEGWPSAVVLMSECCGETFANRAVTTAEDVEQATEEKKLIANRQGFLETSFFFSYQEARNILLHS